MTKMTQFIFLCKLCYTAVLTGNIKGIVLTIFCQLFLFTCKWGICEPILLMELRAALFVCVIHWCVDGVAGLYALIPFYGLWVMLDIIWELHKFYTLDSHCHDQSFPYCVGTLFDTIIVIHIHFSKPSLWWPLCCICKFFYKRVCTYTIILSLAVHRGTAIIDIDNSVGKRVVKM